MAFQDSIDFTRRSATGRSCEVTYSADGFRPEVVFGSAITFTALRSGLSLASSSLEKPCQPDEASKHNFWSGDLNLHETFTISDIPFNETIFFYDPNDRNCADGAVGVVNPTDILTLDAFREAAARYNRDGAALSRDALPHGDVRGRDEQLASNRWWNEHGTLIGIGIAAAIALLFIAGICLHMWRWARSQSRHETDVERRLHGEMVVVVPATQE